jgi:hypothetical protein
MNEAETRAEHIYGWIEWKYADGRTLDEVKRQSNS